MSEYIDRDAFIADKRWLYCTDCDRRKGKKRGKLVTLYEIGEAPCKSCWANDMIEEIEVYPAADVRPVEHGVWLKNKYRRRCRDCGCAGAKDWKFCPVCGRQMKAEEDDG